MSVASGVVDYRIGEGGPLRRMEVAWHLTTLVRQIAGFVVAIWVPLVLIGLASQWATGRTEPLLHDAGTHVRLLVAAPLFLWLDHRFPEICRQMLARLAGQSFVSAADRPRFEVSLRRAARLSDSWIPETVLASLSIVLGVAALDGAVRVRAIESGTSHPAALCWYALVALPFYQFLLWRSLWRWAIWVLILLDLSRLELRLVPIHPDRRGGIGFLRLPSLRYCAVLLFAVASVMCVEWSGRFEVGTSIESFKPLLLLFAIAATAIAIGPTLAFVPQLYRARHRGMTAVAELATSWGRAFDRRWVAGERTDLGRHAELQGLAAVGDIYRETADQVRLSLFRKRDFYLLVASTTLPVVIVMLARVPQDDWMRFAGTIFGGMMP